MFLELSYSSKELRMNTHVNVIIPDKKLESGESYKTLWLFHGLAGDHSSWMRSSCIERYANEHGIAVVMPGVGRSWYENTAYGANYFNLVADELPAMCRGLFKGMSDRREENLVGGLSMGGYGALKLALRRPRQYYACISLSGALDITRKNRAYSLEEWRSIFGFDLKNASELEGTDSDIFSIVRKNKAEGKPFPKLFMWCGLEDSLIDANRDFDSLLTELSVPHKFTFSEGEHSWKWWDMHIQNGLKYVFEE